MFCSRRGRFPSVTRLWNYYIPRHQPPFVGNAQPFYTFPCHETKRFMGSKRAEPSLAQLGVQVDTGTAPSSKQPCMTAANWRGGPMMNTVQRSCLDTALPLHDHLGQLTSISSLRPFVFCVAIITPPPPFSLSYQFPQAVPCVICVVGGLCLCYPTSDWLGLRIHSQVPPPTRRSGFPTDT